MRLGKVDGRFVMSEVEGKTPKMLLLELRFGQSIEELLVGSTVREVGKRLGIHSSLVSRWRHKLGIRPE